MEKTLYQKMYAIVCSKLCYQQRKCIFAARKKTAKHKQNRRNVCDIPAVFSTF